MKIPGVRAGPEMMHRGLSCPPTNGDINKSDCRPNGVVESFCHAEAIRVEAISSFQLITWRFAIMLSDCLLMVEAAVKGHESLHVM